MNRSQWAFVLLGTLAACAVAALVLLTASNLFGA